MVVRVSTRDVHGIGSSVTLALATFWQQAFAVLKETFVSIRNAAHDHSSETSLWMIERFKGSYVEKSFAFCYKEGTRFKPLPSPSRVPKQSQVMVSLSIFIGSIKEKGPKI